MDVRKIIKERDVREIILAAARSARVAGAVSVIMKHNDVVAKTLLKYAAWMGPLAKTEDGDNLLSKTIGEAVRVYRELTPDVHAANEAFREVLEKTGYECSLNHFVGKDKRGDIVEWNFSMEPAVDFMKKHGKEWTVELKKFRGKDWPPEFFRSWVMQKISPSSTWEPKSTQ